MWNTVVLPRALLRFAFLGTLMIAVHLSIAQLRTPLTLSLAAVTVLLLLMRPIEREIRRSSRFKTRILIVGNQPFAQKLIDEIEQCPGRGYTIVGLVEQTPSIQPRLFPYLILGSINDLSMIVEAVKPDRIVLALSDKRGQMPASELLEFQSNGIVVEDVLDAYEKFSGKLAIEAVTPGQLISSHSLWKPRALKATQRALSFTAALFLLVLFSPALGVIALAILLDSGGPVLFRQMRLGKKGQPFRLVKFRTMQPVDNPTSEWAHDNLTRVTRMGKLLRRLRLDELPQLINVIRGDMNLIGPRPHPVSNVTLFREAIPYYVLRCSVLPGITGWAQIRYCYANNLEQETEKMRYDLYYIKHMSLWMDLQIILSTCSLFMSSFLSDRLERSQEKRPASRPESVFTQTPVALHAAQPARVRAAPGIQYARDSDNHRVEAP